MSNDPNWRLQERLSSRYYGEGEAYRDARRAFTAGYSDGWHGYPQQPDEQDPNAYSAGYWEGYGDVIAEPTTNPLKRS